jgi:predicted transcriptional regulator
MAKQRKLSDLPPHLRPLAERALVEKQKNKGKEKWRIEDLPEDERADLLAGLAEADRGELIPLDQAMREIDRMVDDIIATVGPRAAVSK